MATTGTGRRDAVPPPVAPQGRIDRFAHPALVVTTGVLALLILLVLVRVAGGADPGRYEPTPMTPRCSDAALAVVDDVRATGRLVADWPPRVADGRCVALTRFEGPTDEVAGRVGTALRDLGYRVQVAAPAADGSIELLAVPAAGGSVLLRVTADGEVAARISPP